MIAPPAAWETLDSSRSASISTPLARTCATGRNGSTERSGSISNCPASSTAHSMPLSIATGNTSTEAWAAAGTERASPRITTMPLWRVAVRSDEIATAAMESPAASSANNLVSGSWAAMSALAIAEGT
jgi:hypothetical protein